MAYATAADLRKKTGIRELAEAVTEDNAAPVSEATLAIVIAGTSTTAEPPDQVALAQDVLARIGEALDKASAICDGYLGGVIDVLPVTPVPQLLRDLTLDVARYELHDTRATEAIVDRYEKALEMLADIRDGKVSLVGATGEDVAAGGLPVIRAPDRIFTAETMSGF